MEDLRDLGIAVIRALRLHDCWRDLADAFATRPAVLGDENDWYTRADATPGNEEHVHRINSANVANMILRRALRDRRLPIWMRLAEGEAQVDPEALVKLEHRAISSGVYLTPGSAKSNLEGRPLWVKDGDWALFRSQVMIDRYGVDIACEDSRPAAEPLALWLAMEIRRVRAAMDKARREQDENFEARGLRKSGPRVKVLLSTTSDFCVALTDATIAKAVSCNASAGARLDAQREVFALVKDLTNRVIALAHFVGGGSVVDAAVARCEILRADLAGAFALAAPDQAGSEVTGPASTSLARKRGRRKGDGSMKEVDAPMVLEMRALIDAGRAISSTDAAKHLPDPLPGRGTRESREARLALRYREAYPKQEQ